VDGDDTAIRRDLQEEGLVPAAAGKDGGGRSLTPAGAQQREGEDDRAGVGMAAHPGNLAAAVQNDWPRVQNQYPFFSEPSRGIE